MKSKKKAIKKGSKKKPEKKEKLTYKEVLLKNKEIVLKKIIADKEKKKLKLEQEAVKARIQEDYKIKFSSAIGLEFSYNKDDFPYDLRKDLIDSLKRKIGDLNISKGGVTIIIKSVELL